MCWCSVPRVAMVSLPPPSSLPASQSSFFCWRLSPPVESLGGGRAQRELRLSRSCFHWFSPDWRWDWRVLSQDKQRAEHLRQWWEATCQEPAGATASCRDRMLRSLPRRMWLLETERGQWWFLHISCVAALSTHCEERGTNKVSRWLWHHGKIFSSS